MTVLHDGGAGEKLTLRVVAKMATPFKHDQLRRFADTIVAKFRSF